MGVNHIRIDSGVVDPQWSCYVDGDRINTVMAPSEYPKNNWQLCSAIVTYGSHTITVNATVTRNQTFWFDRMEYVPSTTVVVPVTNKTITLTSVDPEIQYGSGWNRLESIANWPWMQVQVWSQRSH